MDLDENMKNRDLDEKLTKQLIYEIFVQEVAAIHRKDKVDPSTSAFLDSFIILLRGIRDNPGVSESPASLHLMERAGIAAIVAAGISNTMLNWSPPKSQMN